MPAITASVVGVSDPQTVQVVVTGLVVGEAYEVRGSWAGGQWPVRAGRGVATETQLILGDAATPVNTVITYAVVTDSGEAASAPITVNYDGRYVLQSLDAALGAAFRLLVDGAPRTKRLRTQVFDIPGRARPIVRFDVPAGESGQMTISTSGPQTAALDLLLSVGAPLIMRTDGLVRDFAAVEYLAVVGAQSTLTGANPGVGNTRQWLMAFEVIDDPDPDTLVATSTWDDFDAAYDGLTGGTFDTEWAGLSGDDFDREDWASRVSTIGAVFGFGFGPYGSFPFGL